jgi:hypothetical protein
MAPRQRSLTSIFKGQGFRTHTLYSIDIVKPSFQQYFKLLNLLDQSQGNIQNIFPTSEFQSTDFLTIIDYILHKCG